MKEFITILATIFVFIAGLVWLADISNSKESSTLDAVVDRVALDVNRYYDEEWGVACYYARPHRAISCVKVGWKTRSKL